MIFFQDYKTTLDEHEHTSWPTSLMISLGLIPKSEDGRLRGAGWVLRLTAAISSHQPPRGPALCPSLPTPMVLPFTGVLTWQHLSEAIRYGAWLPALQHQTPDFVMQPG